MLNCSLKSQRETSQLGINHTCTKMFNNVPAKIKPIGTLQDFSATHLGHYKTFFRDINKLFRQRWKTFPPGALPPVSFSPRVDLCAVVFRQIFLALRVLFLPPPRGDQPFGTLVDMSKTS